MKCFNCKKEGAQNTATHLELFGVCISKDWYYCDECYKEIKDAHKALIDICKRMKEKDSK